MERWHWAAFSTAADWKDAERHFRRSIALNPKLASVRAFFAIFLATLGKHEESIAEAKTGRDLDPLSPLVNMSVGWALYFAGRLDEAVAELRQSSDLHRGQNADEPHSVMIVSYELLGRFEEAAQTAMGHNCFGVPVDGQALLAAWQSGGAPRILAGAARRARRRVTGDGADGPLQLRLRTRAARTSRGRDDSSRLAPRAETGQRRVSCRRASARPAAIPAGFPGPAHSDWRAPFAQGFRTE